MPNPGLRSEDQPMSADDQALIACGLRTLEAEAGGLTTLGTAMQDGLGRLNDVETARRLLARLAEREGGREADAVLAAGLVTGWYAALADRSVGKLDKAWTHLHERKPFWIG